MGAGAGLAMTSVALAPFSGMVAFASDAAAKFEQQMDAVSAVSNSSASEMNALGLEAKRLGATTIFTATEAGAAMEELARMGFDTSQILGATSGVVALAAADNMKLEQAALVTASALNAFQLKAEQSNRVADVLAKASALSATNVSGLGEALRYAAPDAQRFGVNLQTTTAFLGALADQGRRNTTGGTALANALIKLSTPSEKASAAFKKYNIEIVKTKDGSLDLVRTMESLSKGLSGIQDKVKKGSIAKEILGMRGSPLLAAFEGSKKNMVDDGQGGQVDKFTKMLKELENQFLNGGAAEEMAAKRLDNFLGQVTLLKSALEGLSIETMSGFLPGAKESLKVVTEFISDVVVALQIMSGQITKNDAAFSGLNKNAVAVAQGIARAIRAINGAIETLKTKAGEVADMLGFKNNPEMFEKLAYLATLFVAVAAVAAPILGVLAGIALFAGAVLIPVFTIGLKAILLAFGAVAGIVLQVTAVLGLVVFAINSMGAEGETFGETMRRVWDGISGFVMDTVDSIVAKWGEIQTFMAPLIQWVTDAWGGFSYNLTEGTKELVGSIILAFEFLKPAFQAIFSVLSGFFKVFGSGSLAVIGTVLHAVGGLLRVIIKVVTTMIEGMVGGLQMTAKALVLLAPKGMPLPDGLREFANQPRIDLSGQLARYASEDFGKLDGAKPEGDDIMSDPNFGNVAGRLADQQAANTKTKTKSGVPSVEVAMDLTDNRTLDVNNCVTMDGRKVAASTAKNQVEVNERRGFKATPWQRRVILEQGAQPVITGG
jgi:TP901 family phage tail tape measure protein